MYCSPDQPVVGSTVSRSFRYSEFNPVQLAHQNEPTKLYGSRSLPPPVISDDDDPTDYSFINPQRCVENISSSIKTGDWSEFSGWTNIGNITSCFSLFVVAGTAIFIVGGTLFFGQPILMPVFEVVKDFVFLVFGWGWDLINWIAGYVYDAIFWVSDVLGANHWLTAITLGTGLAWAVAEILLESVGLWRKWNDSDFATIFRFLDTPFELLIGVASQTSKYLGWIVRLISLPFEAGLMLLSLFVGGVWELIKWIWRGVFGPSSKTDNLKPQ